MGTFQLALRYIRFHKVKTAILVACIFLTCFLPLAVRIVLNQFNRQIVARAESTPAVVGGQGSRLELALNSLYFQNQSPTKRNQRTIPFEFALMVSEKGWGRGIPLYYKHRASGKAVGAESKPNPIVGTSLDYFEFRQLKCSEGSLFSILGDCVLGANVAARLQLSPGQRLASDAENILDISGGYPLNMFVRGILEKSNTPDDDAVFVDLKTAWIIDDLGHGHQAAESLDENSRLKSEGNEIVTNQAVSTYTEINDSNIGSFHFHGDISKFPITSFIAVAESKKSETLMLAHFESEVETAQMVFPIDEVRRLMQMVFQVESFFRAGALLIGLSTLLLLGLVLALSLRLRQREMQTMFKLGCSRSTILLLQAWELIIVFLLAGLLLSLAIWFVAGQAESLLDYLLLS